MQALVAPARTMKRSVGPATAMGARSVCEHAQAIAQQRLDKGSAARLELDASCNATVVAASGALSKWVRRARTPSCLALLTKLGV